MLCRAHCSLPIRLSLHRAAFPSAPAPAAVEAGFFPCKLQLRDKGLELLQRGFGVSTYHLDTLHEGQAYSLVTREAHHTGWGIWGPLQKCHHCFHTHPAALQEPREEKQSGSGLSTMACPGQPGHSQPFPTHRVESHIYGPELPGLCCLSRCHLKLHDSSSSCHQNPKGST